MTKRSKRRRKKEKMKMRVRRARVWRAVVNYRRLVNDVDALLGLSIGSGSANRRSIARCDAEAMTFLFASPMPGRLNIPKQAIAIPTTASFTLWQYHDLPYIDISLLYTNSKVQYTRTRRQSTPHKLCIIWLLRKPLPHCHCEDRAQDQSLCHHLSSECSSFKSNTSSHHQRFISILGSYIVNNYSHRDSRSLAVASPDVSQNEENKRKEKQSLSLHARRRSSSPALPRFPLPASRMTSLISSALTPMQPDKQITENPRAWGISIIRRQALNRTAFFLIHC